MSDTYLKAILISAVGGLYMIAYSLFYIGTQLGALGQINPNTLDDVIFYGRIYVIP